MRPVIRHAPLATLAVLILFVAACVPHQEPPALDITVPDIAGKTPSQALEAMRRSREELRSLSAYFELAITPPPERGFSSLRGALLMDMGSDSPRARITAFGPLGSTLFDMVRSGDMVQVYVPSQNTLYQGTFEGNATQARNEANPMNEVFSAVLRDPLAMEANDSHPITLDNDTWRIPLRGGALFVDRKSGLVTAFEDAEIRMEFERYTHPAGGPPMPSRIRMQSRTRDLAASFRLEDVEANPDLISAFDLSGYEPKQTRPIEELEKR